MADVSVQVTHSYTTEEAQAIVEKVLHRMAEKMNFSVTWDGNEASMKGSTLKKGHVVVDDSKVDVSIDLALMAKPMKGMVEGMVRKAFEKHL